MTRLLWGLQFENGKPSKTTQNDAVYALAGLDGAKPLELAQFVGSVCQSAMRRFWNAGGEHSAAHSSWFGDWVLAWPREPLMRVYNPDDSRVQFNSLGLAMHGVADSSDELWNSTLEQWMADAGRPGGVGARAWRGWWHGNAVFRELVALALASALYPSELVVVPMPGVSEDDVVGPQLTMPLSGLLTPELGWALCRELPQTSRHKWERIYSSRQNGHSWNTFCGAIEGRGAILLVLREKPDTDGKARVFGAYLDDDLERGPSWHGTSFNFLFTVNKGPDIYRSSGFNGNYQYLNYSTKTMPNGLGVGGQMGHFGLWIDSGFVVGGSNTAATFGSPQLSAQSEFDIDLVEAWLVRPTRNVDSDGEPQGLAVDRNPEAAALLEMANKPMYSKDLPQYRPTEDE
ncbi:hypothetical protein GGF46_003599 [Coemansia sp. RSA 552]|nr:hypothetical protein GGF46_003599 [Coemansia sp. RSA 552]